MKIGIIGYGKMGRDIFRLFFDELTDAEFVVLDLFGAEENTQALLKTLSKSLKRGKISEEQYEAKKASFLFTGDMNCLKGCDMVIEAVFEDMKVKKDTFGRLAELVSDECLLLTNTSSLDIGEIFSNISHKERCFGMHFFYPVKLTGFAELNILPETAEKYTDSAKKIITECGKKPLVFTGSYHIYLNQILSCMNAHALYLRESLNVSVSELRSSLSELYSVADVFEILDSVGLGLMAGKPDSFRIERNRELLSYGYAQMQELISSGCPKETGCFLSFIGENETDTGNSSESAELSMVSLILNELVNALEECTDCEQQLLTEAVQDTLGLAESPSFYAEKYGTDAVFAELDRLYKASGFGSYMHKEKEIWEKYFK